MYTPSVWGEIEVVQRLVSRQRRRAPHGTPRVCYGTLAPERPFDTVFLLDLVRAKWTNTLHLTAGFCSAV
jgi:hypothetical protein